MPSRFTGVLVLLLQVCAATAQVAGPADPAMRSATDNLPLPMGRGVSPFGQRRVAGGPRFQLGVLSISRPGVFAALDSDRDGRLDGRETGFPSHVASRALGRPTTSPLGLDDFTTLTASTYRDWCLFRYERGGLGRPVQRPALVNLPGNLFPFGDGPISWDEWPLMVGRVVLPVVAYGSVLGFERHDANLDGCLDGAEARSLLGEGGQGYRIPYPLFVDVIEEELVHGDRFGSFLELDSNGDLTVDSGELKSGPERVKALDEDGDGALTLRDVLLARLKPAGGSRESPASGPVAPPGPVARSPGLPGRGLALLLLGAAGLALWRTRAGGARHRAGPRALDPDLILGQTHLSQSRFEAAAACFQSVVGRRCPDASRASGLLAAAFLGLGQIDAASTILDGLDCGALDPDTLYTVACALEGQGLHERARTLYGRLYARDVKFRDVARKLEALSRNAQPSPRHDQGQGQAAALRELGERYADLCPIGEGGQKLIYKALDRVLQRQVAVKLVQPGPLTRPESRKRFLREIRVLARLNHPGIIRVIDFRLEPYPYYSMPLLAGRHLGQLAGPGLPPPAERIRLAVEIATALGHAHDHGVIHRNLKPAHVFLTEEGLPCLLDFGLAHAADLTRVTRTGVVCGTPGYTAPEVLRGEPATVASDIYSLGAVLRTLFAGEIPEAVTSILASCLKENPVDRPRSCADLAAALQRTGRPPQEASGSGQAGPGNLVLAGQLEDLYRRRIHVLKNLFGVVERYCDDPDAISRRFFCDRVLSRVRELTGPDLAESLDELVRGASRASLDLAPALKPAAERIVAARPRLIGLEAELDDLSGRPPADQARALDRWYRSLVEIGGSVVAALSSLEISVGVALERAARTVQGEVELRTDLERVGPIRSGCPDRFRGDLESVLENLLQNAIQAGARAVSATGTLSANQTHVHLDLSNDGEEISPTVAERLFSPGFTTKKGGTGSGLATSRRLLAEHGGTLRLRSGRPVAFRLTLLRGWPESSAPPAGDGTGTAP